MARNRFGTLAAALMLVAPSALGRVSTEEPAKEQQDGGKVSGEVKQAGQEFLRDAKEVGKEIRDSTAGRAVEEGTKEFGRDAADASRKGWGKTKSLSVSAADEVRRATREFWDDVIRTKQQVAEKLRKENTAIKARKAEEAPRSEPAKEVR